MGRTMLLRTGMTVFMAITLMFGAAQYASAFIAFPYNFSNGATADADQVNANFQAVNAKQTPTRANMAGTYAVQAADFRSMDIYVQAHFTDANGTHLLISDPVKMSCAGLSHGTMTLTANGTLTMQSSFDDSCKGAGSASVGGTFSVNTDGTGTMSLGGGTISFTVSRDLNVIMWQHGSSEQGIAMRR